MCAEEVPLLCVLRPCPRPLLSGYVFQTVEGDSQDVALASAMGQYWLSFASKGAPQLLDKKRRGAGTSQSKPAAIIWPPWNSSAEGSTLMLATDAKGGITSTAGHKDHVCQFWIPWLEAVMKECLGGKWPCGPTATRQ